MTKKQNNYGNPQANISFFNNVMGSNTGASEGAISEEIKDRYVDLSEMNDYNIKNEVKTSSSQTTPLEDKKSFNFANEIDKKAKIIKETDKAYLLLINYKRWNKDRTGKDNYSIIAWFNKNPFGKNGKVTLKPIQENVKEGYQDRTTIGKRKPTIALNSKDDKYINEGIKIKSRGVRASLKEAYFTKQEIKTLPNEIEAYFRDLDIPKYYDISINEVEDGKYDIRGNIDYGDLYHDHKYFDEQIKKFFKDKDIDIEINEPKELQSEKDEDNIYSSVHIIKKLDK